MVRVNTIEFMRILRFSALNILKILSSLNALRAESDPLSYDIVISTIDTTTIRVSKILNLSLIKALNPRPIIFTITSIVKIKVNT